MLEHGWMTIPPSWRRGGCRVNAHVGRDDDACARGGRAAAGSRGSSWQRHGSTLACVLAEVAIWLGTPVLGAPPLQSSMPDGAHAPEIGGIVSPSEVLESAGAVPAGFVRVPANGSSVMFEMGDAFADGSPIEKPLRRVQLSAFSIAPTEVTWAEWQEVRDWGVQNGFTELAGRGAGKADNHPVHSLTWWEALKWCNAKSLREGREPCYYEDSALAVVLKVGSPASITCDWEANGYRLPTEAEWECAARAGVAGHRFPWSDADTITHARANFNSSSEDAYDVSPTRGYHTVHATGAFPYTSPVGNFAANGFGLFDMAGNVGEMCWDWSGGLHADRPDGEPDPRGPAAGEFRMYRGGSWLQPAQDCRVSARGRSGVRISSDASSMCSTGRPVAPRPARRCSMSP